MLPTADVTVDPGQILLGLGGLVTAMSAAALSVAQARRARQSAREAAEASPASLVALKANVTAVLEAHQRIVAGHIAERDTLEKVIAGERKRADQAEAAHLNCLADVASLRVEFAGTQAQMSELRTRFEAAMAIQ